MLRLAREQARKWWLRPIWAALALGGCVGAMEWLYEDHGPAEWRLAYVAMAVASMVVSGLYTNIHCRERRAILLRMLPVPNHWPAVNRVLVPILLHAIGCATTFGFAWVSGAFEIRPGFSIRLLGFMSALLVLQQFELIWMELRPRLDWLPFGRVFYYGLPGVAGAVVGFLVSASDFDVVAMLDLGFLLGTSAAGLVLAFLTVLLYLRRSDYASSTA